MRSIDIQAFSAQWGDWVGLIPADRTKMLFSLRRWVTLSDWRAYQSECWVIIYRTFPGRPQSLSVQTDTIPVSSLHYVNKILVFYSAPPLWGLFLYPKHPEEHNENTEQKNT